MDRIVIEGGARLEGTVQISGAKNAVLPIMASALLADGPTVIDNPPDVRDVRTLLQVLETLGVRWEWNGGGVVVLEVVDEEPCRAPYELVSQMRASVCVLGPLVAKRGQAQVSLPGGCAIGVRPIDLHRKGIETLNATTR
ncbi:MAG: UDP-N-acetylglucosamine 1-carboxyvinyltransferase, partial [Planctomycetota bacterium]